jgi:hypothetical protein
VRRPRKQKTLIAKTPAAIVLAAVFQLSAPSVALSEQQSACILPIGHGLTAEEIAEVQREAEAAIRAEYSVKADTVRKYLGRSNATTHPGFQYVFCRLAIEDKGISVFARFRLVMIFVVEGLRREFRKHKPE